ncbi:hypothetical protein [Agrococcus sp. HG114]|uniref:hypothetical protein n=1 Tax=Agrococcus sp. HG114 TaxID=2969757 RepID=UPI00215A581E|nr:hypothetical protein [Agrococcus sp. HG114]MCR8671470.1 hypothetical protein [Agrococcus sp. HG114]
MHAGPQSPKGRWIEYVEGDPGAIVARGQAIESLGESMQESATTLERVQSGTDGQKGLAVEKLREVVGDSHSLLRKAGELYEPTGPVLVAYGEALADVQPRIRSHVDRCAELWAAFAALPGSVEPRGTGGWLQPEPDSPEAQRQAEEDAAKLAAYEAWEREAGYWDADYDTWEDAFESAANGIGTVLEGKVEDGFWDDVDGFVAGVQKTLSWAGLVVGVLAIIFGGPILALIGAVIGLVALGLTIYQKIRGDAGWVQLGLAIVGVLPWGKLGKISTGKFSFADDMFGGVFGATAWRSAGSQARELGFAYLFHGRGLSGALGSLRQFATGNNPNGFGDVFLRLMTGKDVAGYEKIGEVTGVLPALATASDLLHGLMGVPLKYDGWISMFTGHETIKKKLPALDVVW